MLFSGNKDLDLKILSELNDVDLASICKVNVTAKKYCNDENFWLNRTLKRFGQLGNVEELRIYSKGNKTWKEYYIHLINFLEHYYEDNKIIFENSGDFEDLFKLSVIIRENTNKFLNNKDLKYEDFQKLNPDELIDLGNIFGQVVGRYIFKNHDERDLNEVMDIFKYLLQNPQFKVNNVIGWILDFDELLDILFNDRRIRDESVQRKLFKELNRSSLYDKDNAKMLKYLDRLISIISEENILEFLQDYSTIISERSKSHVLEYLRKKIFEEKNI